MIKVLVTDGENLLEALFRQGYSLPCCGGKGTCGRCRVRFTEKAPLPKSADRLFFAPEQLRAGYRLACLAKPQGDSMIEVHFAYRKDPDVVTQYYRKPHHTKRIELKPVSFIAIDLGTTTIALQWIDGEFGQDGVRLGEQTYPQDRTIRRMNPGRRFGADVIARIQASNEGRREELRQLMTAELESGIKELMKLSPDRKPMQIIVSANTAMTHLLMGYDAHSLGRYPFEPVSLSLLRITLGGIETIILPGISAFVGGDIVSGIYATGLHKMEKVALLVDLGTNGEMALGNGDRILTTATAAGPAFEGGKADMNGCDIIGSDMISLTADLLNADIIDETGKLEDAYFDTGYQRGNIRIMQGDIRDLQMAKAAVRAGIECLVEEYGISYAEINAVYLAGGFGYRLDVQKAIRIGLFPEALYDKITAVGNSSLWGAVLYGEAVCRGESCAEEVTEIAAKAEGVRLAGNPGFEARYMEALNFPQ